MDEPHNVLIVDDDPGLLFPLSRDLDTDRENYRLLLAQSGDEALGILQKEKISLVVSDVNMPGIGGFDLLAAIRERHPHAGVILMTAYGTENMRRISKDCGCLHFLEKPFRFSKLKELIRQQLAMKNGFNGTLKNILLTDLIQIFCISGSDMAIKVSSRTLEGALYIASGEIIHAECGEEKGEAALFQIMGWESGLFESFPVENFPEPTIDKPYMHLLLEASRQSDESRGSSADFEEDWPVADNGALDLENAFGIQKPQEHVLRVMIVDDSAVMCRILSDTFLESKRIEIVGTASNGQEALKRIDDLKPDLITLDVNMPVMGGETALKHIMIRNRCPVVIVSSINSGSCQKILDFLLLGAVDFIPKPVNQKDVARQKARVVEKILQAGTARTCNFIRYKPPAVVAPDPEPVVPAPARRIVLVYSGAGGYGELIQLLAKLPTGLGICLVVVHDTQSEFLVLLSRYVQQRSRLAMALPHEGQPLLQEHCYFSTPPGGALEKTGEAFRIRPADEANGAAGNRMAMPGTGAGDAMVVMLSGARVEDFSQLERFSENGGRLLVKAPNSCMVSNTLEEVIRSGLAPEIGGLAKIVDRIGKFYS